MKRYSFALVALAAALAITPSAMADTWNYTIDGANFTSNLTLFTSSNNPNQQTITAVSGTFDILSSPSESLTFGYTPTENAVTVANPTPNAYSLTTSLNGEFLFDDLLYPGASGNGILDWGGLLVDISGYELNIFSGASGSGAPGDAYFYFADNGAYHYNDPIPDANKQGYPATDVNGDESLTLTGYATAPEPSSLFLLGTGLLGFALLLFRKASKPSSNLILS